MVEVKPGMRSRFVESGELCSEFPYRAKALFAFEEIDGTDICFFGMHVQVSHKLIYYLIAQQLHPLESQPIDDVQFMRHSDVLEVLRSLYTSKHILDRGKWDHFY